ncbi:MAG: hypothetical protein V9H69_04335 [Anaerolineae bacterium]
MPGWAERREALLAAGQNLQPALALTSQQPTVNSPQWPAPADGNSPKPPWRSEPDCCLTRV